MIDRSALETCSAMIRQRIGSLDDLPNELANTVANIYYRFALTAGEAKGSAQAGWLPRSVFGQDGFERFLEDSAFTLSCVETLPEMIEGLRAINHEHQPRLYTYTVDYLLDILKYRIPGAVDKTGLRRSIERRFRRGKVDEIADLYQLISTKGQTINPRGREGKNSLNQEKMADRALNLLGSMLVDEGHERFRMMVAKGYLGFTANSVFYSAERDKIASDTIAYVKLSDIPVLSTVREAKSAAGTPMVPQELMISCIEIARSAKPWLAGSESANKPISLQEYARVLAAGCHTIPELEQAVRNFPDFELKKLATQTVFADGNPNAQLMLVGEAPGADDDAQGKPFVGASGHLLDRILHAIGYDRGSAYITHLLPWRPPGNRQPTPEEIEVCLPFLVRHIELVQPAAIVLLGGTASKAVLDTKEGILRLRGRWFERTFANGQLKIPILVTYHPAYLLRAPEKKRDAWRDFLTLKRFLSADRGSAGHVGQ